MEPFVSKVVRVVELVAAAMEQFAADAERRSAAGTLITLRCGHNGGPSRSEVAKMDAFLRKCGWLGEHHAADAAT